MALTVGVDVPAEDRAVLEAWQRSSTLPAGLVKRARIVLLAAEGVGTNEIVELTDTSRPTVSLWKRRYAAEGIAGLESKPKPGRPRRIDDAEIVVRTLEAPPEHLGLTHWSSRMLAAELGCSNVKVAQVWKEWGLQPWRQETFKFGPPGMHVG